MFLINQSSYEYLKSENYLNVICGLGYWF